MVEVVHSLDQGGKWSILSYSVFLDLFKIIKNLTKTMDIFKSNRAKKTILSILVIFDFTIAFEFPHPTAIGEY